MSKSKNVKPKPCPFCGSDKVHVKNDHRGIMYI